MPYKPKLGGNIYNQKLAKLAAHNRQIREAVQAIVESGPSQAQLFQILTAVVLKTAQIDEVIADLSEFDS